MDNEDNNTMLSLDDPKHPARLFIQEAESHVGDGGHAWVQSMTSIGNLPWCAATCCAVAKATGYADINMPSANYLAAGFGTDVVQTYGGTRINGPKQGDTSAVPQVGDFVIYQHGDEGEWGGYHIGMVRYCEGDTVYTVEGNTTGSTYSYREKNRTGSNIGWYARPDWTKVGGVATTSTGTALFTGGGGALYDTESSNADAAVREVGYLSTDGKPSIDVTGIKLAVVNYTKLLASIVALYGGTSSSGGGTPDNIDALDPVPREIVTYLTNKGLCTAAGIGVIANIKSESGFDTSAVGDYGTSFGLCQWHNDRGTAMKNMAGTNWASNLTGQLDYLWHELTGSYNNSVLIPLQNVENTLEGAKSAAETWCRKFEIPDKVDDEVKKRQANAEEYWNMIVVTPTSTTTTNITLDTSSQGAVKNQSGQTISQGTSVSIPSSVSQTGIIANYTYYDRSWANNTIQRTLYNLWVADNKPSSHGVATLRGYYLVALAPKFGTTGDVVSIVLEDGTYFNAILGDAKGADAASEYGHKMGNGQIDIVEWESATNNQATLRSGLSEAGWLNKNVNYIINYGSWLTGSIT